MSLTVSACIIVWNEEEMLPGCLKYLLNSGFVTEVCIVDSQSTDRTEEIITRFREVNASRLPVRYARRDFDNFKNQRNYCLDMATGDWVLQIDADETYSQPTVEMVRAECQNPEVLAVRFPTVNIVRDRRHMLVNGNTDPHVRLWRRGKARYVRDVHEYLEEVGTGRNLHSAYDKDVVTCGGGRWPHVWMKHHQLLKSRDALSSKGARWGHLGMLEASTKVGIPIDAGSWLRWQAAAATGSVHPVQPLPIELYDSTSFD